jgi:D-glycero-D-manno-heptose 1,7-bisphosphate phosphatase
MTDTPAPRIVILDRDGVINEESDAYIKSVDEWHPVPGSIDAIAKLSKAGYLIAVATNQSGLARGYFDEITLANIHNLMNATVEAAGGHIDTLSYCPHGPDDNCSCRKPLTGLLDQIEDSLSVSVAGAWFVGDTQKDIDVARAKSCKPVLVRSGKGLKTEARLSEVDRVSVPVFDDLAHAVDHILSHDAQPSLVEGLKQQ